MDDLGLQPIRVLVSSHMTWWCPSPCPYNWGCNSCPGNLPSWVPGNCSLPGNGCGSGGNRLGVPSTWNSYRYWMNSCWHSNARMNLSVGVCGCLSDGGKFSPC